MQTTLANNQFFLLLNYIFDFKIGNHFLKFYYYYFEEKSLCQNLTCTIHTHDVIVLKVKGIEIANVISASNHQHSFKSFTSKGITVFRIRDFAVGIALNNLSTYF